MDFFKKFLFSSHIFVYENSLQDIQWQKIKKLTSPPSTKAVQLELNDREINDAKMVFDIIKSDGTDWITIDQIRKFMNSMGFYVQTYEIYDAFAEIQHNHVIYNKISSEQFALFFKHVTNGASIDDAKTAFNKFDRCGKGFIIASDILVLLNNMEINTYDINVDEMIAEVNNNKSGIITLQDFIRCIDEQEDIQN